MNLGDLIDSTSGTGLGTQAATGAINLAFGQAQQLDASKYQIDNGAGKDANKNMITVLSFVGGIVLVALIAIAIALK
jgi:hypothetical protein